MKIVEDFTSQDDCRGLERGERIGGKYIGRDGTILHPDLNVACNIAIRAKETFKLDNLASVCYRRDTMNNINKQAAVNPPIVGGSHLQASTALA